MSKDDDKECECKCNSSDYGFAAVILALCLGGSACSLSDALVQKYKAEIERAKQQQVQKP